MTNDTDERKDYGRCMGASKHYQELYGIGLVAAAERRQQKLSEDIREIATMHAFYIGNTSEELDTRPTIEHGNVYRRFGFYDTARPQEHGLFLRRTRIPLTACLTLKDSMVEANVTLAAQYPKAELPGSIKPRLEALITDLEKVTGKIDTAYIRALESEPTLVFLEVGRQRYTEKVNPDYNPKARPYHIFLR